MQKRKKRKSNYPMKSNHLDDIYLDYYLSRFAVTYERTFPRTPRDYSRRPPAIFLEHP